MTGKLLGMKPIFQEKFGVAIGCMLFLTTTFPVMPPVNAGQSPALPVIAIIEF